MSDNTPSRRTILAGLAGMPLGALLADPVLAQAAAQQTELKTITTLGGRPVSAALAKPEKVLAGAVLLIHEWWGLNDQIKTMAVEFARQGYLALAVDLFQGRIATTPENAKALTQGVNPEEASDTLVSWMQWLRNSPDANRSLATVGWCFGGGWALTAATLAPVDATVVYYGRVNLAAEALSKLQGPVLGHFATKDQHITRQEIVAPFEETMKQVKKDYTVHWYDADHAFANPTGNNYNKEDAQLAWSRTLAFLKQTLK